MKLGSIAMAALFVMGGCASSSNTKQSEATDASGSHASAASIRKRTNADPSTSTPQKKLGEGEVRMAVLVLPGDAMVDVDKVPARRRNGMIELVGKVGDERRVEVFWGANVKIEHVLKIEVPGGSLPLIDAEEESKSKVGLAKTPAVFDVNE